MLDPIALLQSLTLPSGAITGQRIVLDGVNGIIQIFDSSNALVAQIDANQQFIVKDAGGASVRMLAGSGLAEILFRPPDLVSHTIQEALIRAINLPSGGKTYPELRIFSPGIDAQAISTIDLVGVATDGSVGFIDLEPSTGGYVQVGTELRVSGDNQAAGRSLPRGLIVAPLKGTANSGTAAVGAETKDTSTGMGDLVFTAVTGRRYRIMLQCHVNISVAANTEIEVRIRDGGASSPTTTSTLLFSTPDFLSINSGSGQVTNHAEAYFDCTTDIAAGTHTIAAFISMTAGGGGGNALLAGSAAQPKSLAVEDVGPIV